MDTNVSLSRPLLTATAARQATKNLTVEQRYELREVGRRTLAKLRKQRRASLESAASGDDSVAGSLHHEGSWCLSSYASSAAEDSCNLSDSCLHSEDPSVHEYEEQVDCLMAHVSTLVHEREQWQSEAVRLRRELDSLQMLVRTASLD